MKTALQIGLSTGLLLACCGGALGQTTGAATAAEAQRGAVMLSSGPPGSVSPSLASADIFREIDDPHSGARWLLMRNQEHPAGPGRLVQVGESGSPAGKPLVSGGVVAPAPALPVVRAGDTVIVEEKTAVVDAHLEAVALGPAAIGSLLEVRLKIGGKVVRVMLLAPGRAAFQGETEARR
jgi:hypothetical protein